jgi:hypothetical protein
VLPSSSAELLSPETVRQAKRIAAAIRDGEVAPLIGAGPSAACGLTDWKDFVRRMILAWKAWDPSSAASTLSDDDYVKLFRDVFGGDLGVVSYLRRPGPLRKRSPSFGQLVYPALYGDPAGNPSTPEPNQVHRHLVAMFADHPQRIWTTNYDDLIEEAARLAQVPVRTLDPYRRRPARGLTVAHLHGFLAPPSRTIGHPGPSGSPIVLAEDDYHAVSADVIGWTNREFHRLFDERRVLILGMSLGDPNLRRVLLHTPTGRKPRHFAVMTALPDSAANGLRSAYWLAHGVEIVALPSRGTLLPFLTRLRYESYGAASGELWQAGATYYPRIDPWDTNRQRFATLLLQDAKDRLAADFAVTDPSEVVEVGMFLLKDDARTLELTFRGGAGIAAMPGEREFSADPSRPTGTAGRVFVSGDLVRISKVDPIFAWGVDPASLPPSRTRYGGVVTLPVVDWRAGGIPYGVIYVTVSRTDGSLFALPSEPSLGGGRSIEDLSVWLHTLATDLISSILR